MKGVRTRGRGGGTPLYKPYRYVPPRSVVVLGLFGLKTLESATSSPGLFPQKMGGAPPIFGGKSPGDEDVESGMGFEETTGTYISMNVFIVSIPNE